MNWLKRILHRRSLYNDLSEEMRVHLEEKTEQFMREGLSRQQAEQAARRAFGNPTLIEQRSREVWQWPRLESIWADVKYAFRQFGKSPGFTVVVLSTLALGIGGNTAIFSIVNGVLLNPLPFPQSDRLVALHENKPNFESGSISYPNFIDWRKNNHTFSAMALARVWAFSMTGKGDAEQLNGDFVSAGFFALLGVHPLLGREFTLGEERPGGSPVALISEGLWRRKFNAAPNILGQTITLDGRSFTIVGVIPASMHLDIPGFRSQDLYEPIGQRLNPLLMTRSAGLGYHGIARLKPGVTVAQARADMQTVTHDLAVAYPEADRGIGASIVPLKDQIVGDSRPFLFVLITAVGFVLLIACVNVASLLLARSVGRSREFAVRVALGATRGRVIRQLITEGLLLGLAAGAISLVPAVLGTHAALRALPAAIPRADEIGLDFRVLAFTAIVSLFTGTLFGLAPALKVSPCGPSAVLKNGARGTSDTQHRVLGAFVVAEMAIAIVLLTGAGLMIRSLVRLWNVDPGFDERNVLTFGLSMPPSMKIESPEKIRAAFRDMNDRLASIPQIKAASPLWGAFPMNGDDEVLFWPQGRVKPTSEHDMSWAIDYIVQPDYLHVMKIPLSRGRFFTAQDDEHSLPVAVVDDVFARTYFPGQDAIGKHINLSNPARTLEIVGVVGHVKQWGLDLDDSNPLRAQLYLACMQMPDDFIAMTSSGTGMVVRYDGNLSQVLDQIRRTNKQISAEQVIYGTQTMESVISDSMTSRRFAMIVMGAFATLALLLACVGIYGVMAYLVSQRTQEVGIRMALGAQRRDVLLQVLRNGAKLTLIGVAIGIGSAIALTRLMRDLLFNVSPTDPEVLVGVAALLVLVAITACIIPARRAASIDPMQALRAE